VFSSVLDSLIIFGLATLLFGDGLLLPDGTVADIWFFGTTIFNINLLAVTVKAAITTEYVASLSSCRPHRITFLFAGRGPSIPSFPTGAVSSCGLSSLLAMEVSGPSLRML